MDFKLLLEKSVKVDSTLNSKEQNVLFVDRIETLFASSKSKNSFINITIGGVEKIFENTGSTVDPVVSIPVSNGQLKNNILVHIKEGKRKLELNKQTLKLFNEQIVTPKINTWNQKKIEKTINEKEVEQIFEKKKPSIGVMAGSGFTKGKKKVIKEETVVFKPKKIILVDRPTLLESDAAEYVKPEEVFVDVDPVNKEQFYDPEYVINEQANKNKPASWYLEPYVPVEIEINFVDIFKRELMLKECIDKKIAIRVEAFNRLYKSKGRISFFVDSKNNILELKNSDSEPTFHFYKGKLAGYPIVDGENVVFSTEQFTSIIVENRKQINLVQTVISAATGEVISEDVLSSYFSSPLNFTPVTQEMYFSAPSRTKRYNFTVNSKEKNVRIVDVMTGKISNIQLPVNEIFSYTPYFDGDQFVLNTASLNDTSDALAQVGYIYKTKRYGGEGFQLLDEKKATRVEQFNYYVSEARRKIEEESSASRMGDSDAGDPYPYLALINDNTVYMKLIREPTTPIKRITYISEVFDDDITRRINPPSGYITPPPSS